MGKSKEILKCFMIVIYMDIFFLGAELMAAYIESKPIKIISCINISCFSILLILTIIKLVRKDNELSMYSSLLLFGCSISWMMPMLLYGSLFGKNTGIVTGILYAISIGIGILIPIVQGKVNKNKPFWIAIRKIAAIFTTCSISVLIVLGRVFRGGHGGRLMQKTMSTASRGKLMWGIVLVMSMILGGECETWNNIIYSETEAVKLIIRQQNDHCNFRYSWISRWKCCSWDWKCGWLGSRNNYRNWNSVFS